MSIQRFKQNILISVKEKKGILLLNKIRILVIETLLPYKLNFLLFLLTWKKVNFKELMIDLAVTLGFTYHRWVH